MDVRKLFLQVHLWVGLATGLVIAVVCFTGAVLTFEAEILQALNPGRYFVEPAEERLSLDDLEQNVRLAVPDLQVVGVKVYEDPRRSVEFSAGRGGPTTFVDPYTGAILGRFLYRDTFFYTMFALHRWLLAGDIGKMIVGVSTLLFLLTLVSGVIAWWPRNRRQLKARSTIARRVGWKRLNFDLHVSLGIYAAVFLFIMGFTGLAWSFQWFHNGIFRVTRSAQVRVEAPKSTHIEDGLPISYEAALTAARNALGSAHYYSVGPARDPASAVSVRALTFDAAHERATDAVHLDQYSGEILAFDRYADRSLGARTRSAFYPVHVGSIYGMPTRILAFLACLLGATFPVTGMLIWYNKRSKTWKRKLAERRGRDRGMNDSLTRRLR